MLYFCGPCGLCSGGSCQALKIIGQVSHKTHVLPCLQIQSLHWYFVTQDTQHNTPSALLMSLKILKMGLNLLLGIHCSKLCHYHYHHMI